MESRTARHAHTSGHDMALIAASQTAQFYAESFAPWCERARWALDHHGIAYREINQTPVLAELSLRVAARRLSGRVTVPLLVQGGTILMNSDAIARHAEQVGSGETLFPAEHERELAEWMGRVKPSW